MMGLLTASIFLAIMLGGSPAHSDNAPKLSIAHVFSRPDTLVQVPIYGDFSKLSSGVGAFDLYVSYDPNVLSYSGFKDVHADFGILDVISFAPDPIILIAWYNPGETLYTKDTLMVLEFLYNGGYSDLNFLASGDHTSSVYDDVPYPIADVVFSNGSVQEVTTASHSLTVSIQGEGMVFVNEKEYVDPITIDHGETARIEAVAETGWSFVNWQDDLLGQENPSNLLMDKDMTVTAIFNEKLYTITFIVRNRSGIPVNDARITLTGLQHPAGMYTFGDLPVGSYSYSVSREGFLTGTGTATITDSDIEVVVILDKDPVRTSFLKVYPNPTSHLLTIESNESFREHEVYNALGQIVLSSSFNDRLKHTIDVGYLASGMYLIRVFSVNDQRTAMFEVIR